MQIRSENDLKLAYETINSFKEMLPMAQKTDAALEYIKELKRDIRGFFRKEKEKLQRRLVKDNGIDGYIVLMQLPSFLNSKEDAAGVLRRKRSNDMQTFNIRLHRTGIHKLVQDSREKRKSVGLSQRMLRCVKEKEEQA